jgi:UDP-hydrolysing UDP-N-acetyl-D-glucosamine 2-epimerase
VTRPILFLVPARGGSVRVPGKNLRIVAGIPLVGRAVRLALAAAGRVDGGPHLVVCSTDDPDVATVAAAFGAAIVDRPPELATETSSSVDVALHALDATASRDPGPLVLLQPTSPLTDVDDVVAAIEAFERGGGRGVASVTRSHPAGWHVAPAADLAHRDRATPDAAAARVVGPITPAIGAATPTADLILSGAIYVVDPESLRAERRFVGPATIGIEIPMERSVDVDEPADLVIAEAFAAAGATRSAPASTERGPAAGRPDASAAADPVARSRTIAVLTTGRQDWGILHSVAAAIREEPGLRLRLIAGGMHLSSRHGRPLDEVIAAGFEPDAALDWLGPGPADPAPDVQAAAALQAVGEELRRHPVDAIVLAGDRFETAAAALAATVLGIPIVHLHGGEQTLGAFDDALRHAITKLADLHLVSRPEHAARIVAMGEDPATVHVVGSPSLDGLRRSDLPDREELAAVLGLPLEPPVVVVTVHPATLEIDPAASAGAVAAAMDEVEATYVVTLPNVDPGAAAVREILATAVGGRPRRVAVDALGERRYWGLLRVADAMLGNSSSGVAEAPAIGLPVVNVGDRQAGRIRHANVLDVPADAAAVAAALRRALDPAFRADLQAADLPLADGRAGERIAHIIAAWHPTHPPRKAPVVLA